MPDAQIQIEKVWKSDPKEGDYGTYYKYDVQYVGGGKSRYVTFKDELGEKAQANVGRKVLVTFEAPTQEGRSPKITAISDPLDDSQGPVPGTGEYVKGKEAPETQRSIAASVALREAVNYTPAPDDTRDVLAVADSFFEWLMGKVSSPPASGAPNGSQAPAEPSQEQRDRLAEILRKLNTQSPKPEGQKSWGEDLAYYANETFGKTNGLDYDQFQTLVNYAEGLAKDEALPWT